MPPAEKARGDGTHRGTTLFIRKKYKKAVPQGTNSAVPPSLNLYQIISRPCNVGQPVRNYFVHSGCSGRNFPRLCISAYTDRRFSELPIPEVLFPSLLLLDYVHFNPQGISLSSPLSAEDRTKRPESPEFCFRTFRVSRLFCRSPGLFYRLHGI